MRIYQLYYKNPDIHEPERVECDNISIESAWIYFMNKAPAGANDTFLAISSSEVLRVERVDE